MKVIFEGLEFKNYNDFYKRCLDIKKRYEVFFYLEAELKKSQKVLEYRDYIYSKNNLNEIEKNVIWDFLNGYLEREYIRNKYKLPPKDLKK